MLIELTMLAGAAGLAAAAVATAAVTTADHARVSPDPGPVGRWLANADTAALDATDHVRRQLHHQLDRRLQRGSAATGPQAPGTIWAAASAPTGPGARP